MVQVVTLSLALSEFFIYIFAVFLSAVFVTTACFVSSRISYDISVARIAGRDIGNILFPGHVIIGHRQVILIAVTYITMLWIGTIAVAIILFFPVILVPVVWIAFVLGFILLVVTGSVILLVFTG